MPYNRKSIVCVFSDTIYPWEWDMVNAFVEERWSVSVISNNHQSKCFVLRKVLNLLPHKLPPQKTAGHPQYVPDHKALHKDVDYVLCAKEILPWVLQHIPNMSTILYYEIGSQRGGGKSNCATIVDVVRQTGLTPIRVWSFNISKHRHELILSGNTTTDTISVHRNFRQSGFMAYRLIKKIAANSHLSSGNCLSPSVSNSRSKIIRISDSALIIRAALHFGKYVWSKYVKKDLQTSWSIAYCKVNEEDVRNIHLPSYNWRMFKPYAEGQFADPFIWKQNDRTAIFFEYIPPNSYKGEIHAAVLNEDGEAVDPGLVLVKDYHLAYPYIFTYEDKLYLVPDSGHNESVDIYQCLEFPYKWEHVKTLMNGIRMVDCTVFQHENHWWMFGNVVDHRHLSSFDHLHIFHTKDLLHGKWHSHPCNPVISDASNARPAGRIIRQGESLYRPSQNSSFSYGYGLNINHIQVLNTEEYKEQTLQKITPWKSGMSGIHTLNIEDSWMVVDFKQQHTN